MRGSDCEHWVPGREPQLCHLGVILGRWLNLYSFNKCLWSTCHVPDPVLAAGDTAANDMRQTDGNPCPCGADMLVETPSL